MANDTTFNEDVSVNTTPTDDGMIKLNLKVNGEEVEKEFTPDELKAYVQKGLAADEKFREAAELKKSVEEERQDIEELIRSSFEIENDEVVDDVDETSTDESKDEDKPQIDPIINQLKSELMEVKNKQLYMDAKREIEEIQQKYNLDETGIKELILFIQDQNTNYNRNYSLEDAYKILHFGEEKPNKFTPVSGVDKKRFEEVKSWKERILNAT